MDVLICMTATTLTNPQLWLLFLPFKQRKLLSWWNYKALCNVPVSDSFQTNGFVSHMIFQDCISPSHQYLKQPARPVTLLWIRKFMLADFNPTLSLFMLGCQDLNIIWMAVILNGELSANTHAHPQRAWSNPEVYIVRTTGLILLTGCLSRNGNCWIPNTHSIDPPRKKQAGGRSKGCTEKEWKINKK